MDDPTNNNNNIIVLELVTKLELDPDRILSAALSKNLKRVVVLGVLEDGTEYLAMSSNDLACVNWDLDRAKHSIMKKVDQN